MTQCKAMTQSGNQCKQYANDSGYCHIHDPESINRKKAQMEQAERDYEKRESLLNQQNFSQRRGLTISAKEIQIDSINQESRIAIWNVFYEYVFYMYDSSKRSQFRSILRSNEYLDQLSLFIWKKILYLPLQTIPVDYSNQLMKIFGYYQKMEWNEIYDFVEYLLNYFDDIDLIQEINDVLLKKLTGYRFMSGVITDINNPEELKSIDEAINNDEFSSAGQHLQRALELLSDRKNPDYRNSIKESISAVESLVKKMTGDPKATLNKALDKIETSGKGIKIHPALKSAFTSLYAYTCDEKGIRHAMLDEPNVFVEDAKFFLITCSAFINFLKSKS